MKRPTPLDNRNTTAGISSEHGGLASHRAPRPQDQRVAKPGYNDAESPLTWLHSRRGRDGLPLISDIQYVAGERLRADFERSHLAGRTTTNWAAAGTGSRGGNVAADMSDATLMARQRYHKAIEAVGPELSSILRHVCCMASGIEAAERAMSLPPRSGRAVLGLALTGLARHYGLFGRAGGRSGIGRWGTEDYRPAIPELEDA